MATIQNDGTISINRGDVFISPLFINCPGDDDKPIRYDIRKHPNARVWFSIMQPNQSFEKAVIRKVFTFEDSNEFGDVVVKLKSKETQTLMQGKYYYQAKIVLDDGKINTITNKEILYVR